MEKREYRKNNLLSCFSIPVNKSVYLLPEQILLLYASYVALPRHVIALSEHR
jgi:hypothetical protein